MSPSPKKLFDNLMKPFFGKRIKERKAEKDLQAIAATERKVFRYETLVAATGNFSPKQKLGAGGFGPVFKGRLEDGRDVAVKQLSQGSRQGTREFENEALLLSKVQHKNVVNLYGYCAHGDERLLVYEYVANESLDKILFSQTAEDERRKSRELDWQRRYQVALGVARGLLYLHEDAHIPIIHRDIKASNVLLNERWVPKIADFGMARLYREEQTHVKTRVVGTNGYMAPEYVMQGHLSTKADVFSFGVLLLELVSGRKNSSFASLPDPEADSLLDWAWKLYRKGRSLNLMDPTLSSTADLEQVARCVQVALLCTQADHKLRPDMKRVGIILSKKPTALEEPTRPGTSSSRFWRGSYGTRYSGESSSASASASTAASTATTSTSRTVTVHHTSTRPGTSSSRFSGESSSASASASTAASTATTSTSRTATVHHTSSQAQRPGRRG